MREVLRQARRSFPFIERILADAGYQGPEGGKAGRLYQPLGARDRQAHRRTITSSSCQNAGIVERTLAWISRNRRLARDFERYAGTVAAFVRVAMIRLMLRLLTKPTHSA